MSAAVYARLFFWLWFAAAVAAGYFQLLRRLPGWSIPALTLALAALALLAYFRVRPLREWVNGLKLRSLVLLHVTRFLGIYFLILFQRGELPRAFAVPAGIGDIIIATMALPVALAPIEDSVRRRAIVIWNVVGFLDLMLVVLTTARLFLAAPAELRAFTQLPLSLVPTLLVPLLLATHVIIFVRAVGDRARS